MKRLLFLLVMVVPTLAAFDGPYVPTEREHCMALNIYHEARSENMAGKFAVADVVLNRVNDRRYPDTVCGVIYHF